MANKALVGILSALALFCVTPVFGNTKLSNGYIIKYRTAPSIGTYTACPFVRVDCQRIAPLRMEAVQELPEGIQNRSEVEYIEPNYIQHILGTPTDELFPQLWGMKKIGAERAWDLEMGSEEIIVGIVDTGVDYTHPDLKEQMWVNEAEKNGQAGVDDDGNGIVDDIYGANFVDANAVKGDPKDDHGHGSHCGGVIGAGHNGFGVVGVNAKVRIMALKFLDASGSGDTAGAIKAIVYGSDHGAKVLSNSWGGGPFSKALEDAIKYARDKGVLFVAAAGNDSSNNDSSPSYPASYAVSNVISVAATDSNDVKASFTNFGLSVHVAAPGVNVLSTVLKGGYQKMSGTSMACPHVAGASALLLSSGQVKSFEDVKSRIIETSDYVAGLEDVTSTAGRLNIYNMLTDTKPQRPLPPDPVKWVNADFSAETPHPYESNKEYSFEISVPAGATFLRVHFSGFDTEAKYDVVSLVAGAKTLKYDGKLGAFYSRHLNVVGMAKVKLTLKTDASVTSWGFAVDHVQVQ